MTCEEARAAIRSRQPLLHCISNVVTANDCANLALAVGASPIMAQAPQEMAEIAALAAAVVLDPVGVGASHWRLEQIRGLLQCVHPDIVRVNYGEAAALLGLSAAEHGVDSLTVPTDAAACANALAERLGAVVLLSGEEDLVTDGCTLHTVRGGSPLMRRVTGAGCMLSVLCGAFAAVEHDALTAARHAAAFWKSCATAAAAQARGSASFRTALLDEASL